MVNNFKFYSKENSIYLTKISTLQASKYIDEYNIYFNTYIDQLDTRIQNLDIYQLDNLKDFNSQLFDIKKIEFPFYTTFFFYTDFKTNRDILLQKMNNAKIILDQKKMSITKTNLMNQTKIKDKTIIEDYLFNLSNPNATQGSLFD